MKKFVLLVLVLVMCAAVQSALAEIENQFPEKVIVPTTMEDALRAGFTKTGSTAALLRKDDTRICISYSTNSYGVTIDKMTPEGTDIHLQDYYLNYCRTSYSGTSGNTVCDFRHYCEYYIITLDQTFTVYYDRSINKTDVLMIDRKAGVQYAPGKYSTANLTKADKPLVDIDGLKPQRVKYSGTLDLRNGYSEKTDPEPESIHDIPLSEVTTEGVTYQFNKDETATVTKAEKDLKQVVIPATLTANKKTYKVTAIADNAFKGMKKLTTLTIGKNVKKIGKKAFYNCKGLTKITINTSALDKNSIGKDAFKGVPKTVKIKVPKKKVDAYKTILINAGVNKNTKITK